MGRGDLQWPRRPLSWLGMEQYVLHCVIKGPKLIMTLLPLLSSNTKCRTRVGCHEAQSQQGQVQAAAAIPPLRTHLCPTTARCKDPLAITWGQSRATHRTYMETKPGVTTGLDQLGGMALPG